MAPSNRMKCHLPIRSAICKGFIALLLPALAARAAEFQIPADVRGRPDIRTEKLFAEVLAQIPADEPAHIILRDGIHQLTEPLRIPAGLGRTENCPLVIEAASGEHPVLSGAAEIGGWRKLTDDVSGLPEIARPHVWVAEAPIINGQVLDCRQLWVNDRKAVRARKPNGDGLDRLTAWDKTYEVATIPAAALAGVRESGHLEMVIDQVWEIAVLRVESIQTEGTNAFLTFHQPESTLEFRHPWPPVIMKTNYHAPFFLANAPEFLNSPGEWFEDIDTGKIYYWPRDDEDLMQASVFAPTIETLVQIEGAPDQPIANIEFKGITFARTTWLRPSEQGHVPLQAGMFMLAARKLSPHGTSYHPGLDNLAWIGRPPAAVSVENAEHVRFDHCTFEHLASAGLDLGEGTHDDAVVGCTFQDIGGNGLQVGKFSDTNVETHLPYLPSDAREVCSNVIIANNLVTDCGTEDWGCCGICVGYARDVKIEHNDVFNLPYTGVSVGWGWTKATNCMSNNLIHANHVHEVATRLGDTAGIYTLSAQPGTVISENYIHGMRPSPYVPDPDHWFYLYLDEGSSGIIVRDNWCPSEKFLKNANGPGNVWQNNGPQVSERIKAAAGREPAYQDSSAN